MHIIEANKAIQSGFINTGYGMIMYLNYFNEEGYMLSNQMKARLNDAAKNGIPINYHHITEVKWDPKTESFPSVKLAVESWDLSSDEVEDSEISIG